MKIKRISAIVLLCVMMVSLLASCGERSEIPEGYQLVACEGDCFRLYVPTQGWMPNTASGVTGAFFSMDENASVHVYVADDAGEMEIEEYWEKCNASFEEELDDYSFSGKSEKLVLGGQPARKYVYSASVTLVENGVASTETYKFMTVLCKYKKDTYAFVYSAPEKFYDSHLQDVEGNEDGEGILPYFVFAEPYESGEEKEYSSKVEVPEGMKLISTDERAYRFFVPENWIVNKRTEISAAYYSESDSSNVSLQMYMTGDETQTVEDYFAECESRYQDIFSSYTLLSTEDIEMDGIAAKQYLYTITVGGVEYKQLQAIVLKGAVFYTLTYTALPENFDGHMGDVRKMIENFDIR